MMTVVFFAILVAVLSLPFLVKKVERGSSFSFSPWASSLSR
jgi:hypothetical protein